MYSNFCLYAENVPEGHLGQLTIPAGLGSAPLPVNQADTLLECVLLLCLAHNILDIIDSPDTIDNLVIHELLYNAIFKLFCE